MVSYDTRIRTINGQYATNSDTNSSSSKIMTVPYVIYEYDGEDIEHLNSELYNTIVFENLKDDCIYDAPPPGSRNYGDRIFGGADLHTKNYESVDTVLNWVRSVLPRVGYIFATGEMKDQYEPVDYERLGFNSDSFRIVECWGIHYWKTETVPVHTHFPYTISFSYCINEPNTSPKFVLEGEKIPIEPGKAMFFLSHKDHEILPSEEDGRCCLIGNIIFIYEKYLGYGDSEKNFRRLN